jgi:hypothetical protein
LSDWDCIFAFLSDKQLRLAFFLASILSLNNFLQTSPIIGINNHQNNVQQSAHRLQNKSLPNKSQEIINEFLINYQ